jgi:hypothetical protein
MTVKMQRVLMVYLFRLESSGIQQEAVVVGRVKRHTARSMVLSCHLHQRVQNKTCLYRKTGGCPDSSHIQSQRDLVQ